MAVQRGRQLYGDPSTDIDWGGGPKTRDAANTRLNLLLRRPKRTVLVYTYDFGDNWEHRVTFIRRRHGEAGRSYPRFVAGERACPPEDCGGVWGYADLLETLADEDDPDHAEMSDLYEGFDPEDFDEAAITRRLAHLAG